MPVTPPPPPKPPDVYQKVSQGTTVLDTKLDMYVEELWVGNRKFCSEETQKANSAKVTNTSARVVTKVGWELAVAALLLILGSLGIAANASGKTLDIYITQEEFDRLLLTTMIGVYVPAVKVNIRGGSTSYSCSECSYYCPGN